MVENFVAALSSGFQDDEELNEELLGFQKTGPLVPEQPVRTFAAQLMIFRIPMKVVVAMMMS
jgi:hypothetical protein